MARIPAAHGVDYRTAVASGRPAGVLAGQVITRGEHGGGVLAAAAGPGTRLGVAGVIAGAGFRCAPPVGCPRGMISYRQDDGAWLDAAGDHVPVVAASGPFAGLDVEMRLCMALEDLWI